MLLDARLSAVKYTKLAEIEWTKVGMFCTPFRDKSKVIRPYTSCKRVCVITVRFRLLLIVRCVKADIPLMLQVKVKSGPIVFVIVRSWTLGYLL